MVNGVDLQEVTFMNILLARYAQLILACGAMAYPQVSDRPSGKAQVSGVVLDDVTSRPINRAIVTIRREGGSQSSMQAALTAQDGSFSIESIVPGTYVVTAERPGFLHPTPSNAMQSPNNANRVTVSDAPVKVTVRLMPCGSISGKVIDSIGIPIANATVQLLHSGYVPGRGFKLATVSQVNTNDLGEFRLFDLRPGRYYINAFYRDTASVFGLRRRPVNEEDEESRVGQITEDYAVTYYPGTTDFSTAIALKVQPGRSLPDVNIPMEMTKSVLIEGAIENMPDNAAVPVFLVPLDIRGQGARQMFVVDRPEGRFLFRSIPPGDYLIRSSSVVNGDSLSAKRYLSVGPGLIRGINLRLQPSPSLRGKVNVEPAGAVPVGTTLMMTGTSEPTRIPIQVGADGQFSIPALPRDRYVLDFASSESGLSIQSIRVGGQDIKPPNLIEIDQPIDSMSISVTSASGTISGTVVDGAGRFAQGGLAILQNADGDFYSSRLSTIDDQGRFSFNSLPPNSYTVQCFSDLRDEYQISFDLLKKIGTEGQRVLLRPNEKMSLQVTAAESDQ
jgi:hypothetical protein